MECVLVLQIVRAVVCRRLRSTPVTSDSIDNHDLAIHAESIDDEVKRRLNEQQSSLIEENGKLIEENDKLVEENSKLIEERSRLTEANSSLAEENSKLIQSLSGLALGEHEDERVDVGGSALCVTVTLSDKLTSEFFLQSCHLPTKDVFNDAKLDWDDLDDLTQKEIQVVLLRQRIGFLRTNLDRLTRVHVQLVHVNGEKCELPKLETCLRAMMERVKTLETALKEDKESAVNDHKRYQLEVNRMKQSVAKEVDKKHNHTANIVKPVRAGQQPAATKGKPKKRV